MAKKTERTPQEVYDDLATKGLYEEADFDKDEIEKVKNFVVQDYEYGKSLRKTKDPNWRVIFNIHYDALRELCELLMHFKKQSISNHQGLFAFIVINFPELEFDWKFFEMVRNIRNFNKYKGIDITKQSWQSVELHIDLYIAALKKEIEKILKKS